ncbi:NFAT activation molecule 1 isoform X2 [Amia ocellicauda]|uniref:NFAT activation molecule 1 isoform X2 n=1 Tax=Amia ocellicauda TaxID=2972642 RepID=UPI003463D1C5
MLTEVWTLVLMATLVSGEGAQVSVHLLGSPVRVALVGETLQLLFTVYVPQNHSSGSLQCSHHPAAHGAGPPPSPARLPSIQVPATGAQPTNTSHPVQLGLNSSSWTGTVSCQYKSSTRAPSLYKYCYILVREEGYRGGGSSWVVLVVGLLGSGLALFSLIGSLLLLLESRGCCVNTEQQCRRRDKEEREQPVTPGSVYTDPKLQNSSEDIYENL